MMVTHLLCPLQFEFEFQIWKNFFFFFLIKGRKILCMCFSVASARNDDIQLFCKSSFFHICPEEGQGDQIKTCNILKYALDLALLIHMESLLNTSINQLNKFMKVASKNRKFIISLWYVLNGIS